eukprot:GDKJ01022994.1.p1 GENE.GDKJ01022994.1~~GDKJ01022994.1.p1  ORF type:complete len:696 (-),score=147.93 GDKJ01022994.1:50-2137(-)
MRASVFLALSLIIQLIFAEESSQSVCSNLDLPISEGNTRDQAQRTKIVENILSEISENSEMIKTIEKRILLLENLRNEILNDSLSLKAVSERNYAHGTPNISIAPHKTYHTDLKPSTLTSTHTGNVKSHVESLTDHTAYSIAPTMRLSRVFNSGVKNPSFVESLPLRALFSGSTVPNGYFICNTDGYFSIFDPVDPRQSLLEGILSGVSSPIQTLSLTRTASSNGVHVLATIGEKESVLKVWWIGVGSSAPINQDYKKSKSGVIKPLGPLVVREENVGPLFGITAHITFYSKGKRRIMTGNEEGVLHFITIEGGEQYAEPYRTALHSAFTPSDSARSSKVKNNFTILSLSTHNQQVIFATTASQIFAIDSATGRERSPSCALLWPASVVDFFPLAQQGGATRGIVLFSDDSSWAIDIGASGTLCTVISKFSSPLGNESSSTRVPALLISNKAFSAVIPRESLSLNADQLTANQHPLVSMSSVSLFNLTAALETPDWTANPVEIQPISPPLLSRTGEVINLHSLKSIRGVHVSSPTVKGVALCGSVIGLDRDNGEVVVWDVALPVGNSQFGSDFFSQYKNWIVLVCCALFVFYQVKQKTNASAKMKKEERKNRESSMHSTLLDSLRRSRNESDDENGYCTYSKKSSSSFDSIGRTVQSWKSQTSDPEKLQAAARQLRGLQKGLQKISSGFEDENSE